MRVLLNVGSECAWDGELDEDLEIALHVDLTDGRQVETTIIPPRDGEDGRVVTSTATLEGIVSTEREEITLRSLS